MVTVHFLTKVTPQYTYVEFAYTAYTYGIQTGVCAAIHGWDDRTRKIMALRLLHLIHRFFTK